MNKQEKEKIYKQAWGRWGATSQLVVAMEECAELIQSLSKIIRNETTENLLSAAEEIADVEIMIEQMKLIYIPLDREVNEQKKLKLERLKNRLEIK